MSKRYTLSIYFDTGWTNVFHEVKSEFAQYPHHEKPLGESSTLQQARRLAYSTFSKSKYRTTPVKIRIRDNQLGFDRIVRYNEYNYGIYERNMKTQEINYIILDGTIFPILRSKD